MFCLQQSISSTHSKVEPLSPTPSHRPSCEVMGVVNEAIDVLAYQLPMSPSRMIPPICTVEWSTTTQVDNLNWTLAGSTSTTTNMMQANTQAPMLEGMETHEYLVGQQKAQFNQREPMPTNSMDFEAISPAGSSASGSATPSGMRTPSGARTPSGTVTPPHKTNKRGLNKG